MTKVKIRMDKSGGMVYFPKEIREEGYIVEVDYCQFELRGRREIELITGEINLSAK